MTKHPGTSAQHLVGWVFICLRRTPCRSAASPPHERFADDTPISKRRDRPLQRPVGQLDVIGMGGKLCWSDSDPQFHLLENNSAARELCNRSCNPDQRAFLGEA